jgi:glucosamine kinase
LVIGADVGGSKAAISLVDQEGVRRDMVVPSSEWHYNGGRVARRFVECVREIVGSDMTEMVIAVGAHGTDDVTQCERFADLVEAELPAKVIALNDAELLLPAAGISRGVGLVSGTGSIVIGYGPDDRLMSVGGWGGFFSEEGSGTGLFLDAVRAMTQAQDRGEQPDLMEPMLLDRLGLKELRDVPEVLGANYSPITWAKLVPELYERALALDSPLAKGVIIRSGEVLAGLVALLGRRGCDNSTVVAGGGMISNASWLQDSLRAALAKSCPQSELVILTAPPVDGAVALATSLAQQLYGKEPTTDSVVSNSQLHPAVRRVLSRVS